MVHLCACAPFRLARTSPAPVDLGQRTAACGSGRLLIPPIARWAWPPSVFQRSAPGLAADSMGWDADPAGKAVGEVGDQRWLVVQSPYCERAARGPGAVKRKRQGWGNNPHQIQAPMLQGTGWGPVEAKMLNEVLQVSCCSFSANSSW